MKDFKKLKILEIVKENQGLSSQEIHSHIISQMSYSTLKRILSHLISEKLVQSIGTGKATKYQISSTYQLLYHIDLKTYFEKEIDDREIKDTFNHQLITDILYDVKLFNDDELQKLNLLQEKYKTNIAELTKHQYLKELERLAIDLSWKSSQIEGNTYSLLETERLLKEKETASGKTLDEAVMLLNHKAVLDFILDNPDYVTPMRINKIEDIHSILIKDLGVDRNIRKRKVGITGTNYNPLDNQQQIIEAMEDMCKLINSRTNIFEKALLVLVLLSYIQPFGDGNKRTARIISNAVLIANGYCPISFRSVDSIDYKKALLVFYEQNNISAFKEIFISQFQFAVNTYF